MTQAKIVHGSSKSLITTIAQVALLLVTLAICLIPTWNSLSLAATSPVMASGSPWLDVTKAAMPLVIVAAVYLLRVKDGHGSMRLASVTKSAAVGLLAVLIFLVLGALEANLAGHLLPALTPAWNETSLMQAYGNSWLFAAVYLGALRAIIWKLQSPRAIALHQPAHHQ